MQIWGRAEHVGPVSDDDEQEPARPLIEATFVARPGDLRAVAAFLEYAAGLLETHGPTFGHEHFRDWVSGVLRLSDAYQRAVTQTGREPGLDDLVEGTTLPLAFVRDVTTSHVWRRLTGEPAERIKSGVGILGPLTEAAGNHRGPDVIVASPEPPDDPE